MQKKYIFGIITALAISGIAVFGVHTALADTTHNGQPSLVSEIAQRFGLKQADVQSVFYTHRQQQQQYRESLFEAKLTQDVADNKITAAQKELIIAKHKEIQNQRLQERTAMQSMTRDQRIAEMQKERQALDDWAKQNGIDPHYVFGGFGMRVGHWSEK